MTGPGVCPLRWAYESPVAGGACEEGYDAGVRETPQPKNYEHG